MAVKRTPPKPRTTPAKAPAKAPAKRPTKLQTATAAAKAKITPPRPAGPPPAAPIPTQVDQTVRAQYGYLAAFLDNPEIGPILRQAAQEGWDPARLQGAVFATNWWKTTSQTQRAWTALQSQDPAEAQRQLQAKQDEIRANAQQMGLNLDDARVTTLATNSIQYGWSAQQLTQSLSHEAVFNPNAPAGGDIGALQQRVKAMAADYLVPISDQAAFDWAQKMAAGSADQNGVTAYLATMAKSRWPTMAAQIDQGITPGQFFDPYKQATAQLLEKPPDQIDLLANPLYSKMLDFVDQSGNRRPMTLSEAQTYIRSTPDWRNTRQANQEASQLGENILKDFGQVA